MNPRLLHKEVMVARSIDSESDIVSTQFPFHVVIYKLFIIFWFYINSGAKTNATIDMSLIKMFSAGPEVSLKGSPTVSPTTAAA